MMTALRIPALIAGPAANRQKGIDVAIAVDLRMSIRREYTALVLFSSDTDSVLLSALTDSPAPPDERRSGLLARRQQARFPDRIAREDPADRAKALDELRAAEAGPGPPAPRCSN
jgi:hypothetical protein